MGLAPRTITVTPEVVPYWWDQQRRPLRGWLVAFAFAAFVLALISYPVWGFVLFHVVIGVILAAIAAWVHFAFPKGTPGSHLPGSSAFRRRGRLAPRWIALLVVIGVALVLSGLLTVPTAHTYSAVIPASFYQRSTTGWELHFPGAQLVSGAWGTSGGQVVVVKMTAGSSGPVVSEENGTSGSFQFSQTDVFVYVLAPANATTNVTIDGTYWSAYWTVSW